MAAEPGALHSVFPSSTFTAQAMGLIDKLPCLLASHRVMAVMESGDLGILTALASSHGGFLGTNLICLGILQQSALPFSRLPRSHSILLPITKALTVISPRHTMLGISLTPNHTFVKGPFIKLSTNYPNLSRPSVFR